MRKRIQGRGGRRCSGARSGSRSVLCSPNPSPGSPAIHASDVLACPFTWAGDICSKSHCTRGHRGRGQAGGERHKKRRQGNDLRSGTVKGESWSIRAGIPRAPNGSRVGRRSFGNPATLGPHPRKSPGHLGRRCHRPADRRSGCVHGRSRQWRLAAVLRQSSRYLSQVIERHG
jgi:hypothetical protein